MNRRWVALVAVGVAVGSRAGWGQAAQVGLDPLMRCGVQFCGERQWGLALWALDRAARLAPGDPLVRLWAGHAFCQAGRTREGLEQLQAAAGTPAAPGTPAQQAKAAALAYLGVAAALRGEAEPAGQYFDQAVAADPALQPAVSANRALMATGRPLTWRIERADRAASAPPSVAATPPAGPPLLVPRLLDFDQAIEAVVALSAARDHNEALRLGEWLTRTDPGSARSWLMLAQIYVLKGWLAEASDCFQAAQARATADQRDLIQQATATVARLSPQFRLEPPQQLVSAHFRLRFSGNPRVAATTLAALEQMHSQTLRSLGVELPVVYVRVFATAEQMRQFTSLTIHGAVQAWAPAMALASAHSPAIVAFTHGDVAPLGAMQHEHSHLVTHALAGPEAEVPRWLNEGLAVISEHGPLLVGELVAMGARRNRLASPDQLEVFWRTPNNVDEDVVRMYYQEAHNVTSFLLQRFGEQAALDILLRLRLGADGRQAVQQTIGLTWEQLFGLWAQTCLR